MVCVDNSEYTRNGDYAPTRFQAQADAVNLLAGAKTQHHPENTVGVMTMAGKTPQVLLPAVGAQAATMPCVGCGGPCLPWVRSALLVRWRAATQLARPLSPLPPCAGAGHAHPRPGQGAERDAGDADRGGHQPGHGGADRAAGAQAPAEQEPAAARGHLYRQPHRRGQGARGGKRGSQHRAGGVLFVGCAPKHTHS